MLIESLIRRKRGTEITMDGETYLFQPLIEGGPHVADVRNKAHAQAFLAITEGFAIHDGKPVEGVAEATPPADPDAPSAGEIAMLSVLANPSAADRDEARAAYEFLTGEPAPGRAHTDTIVKRIIDAAIEQGFAAEGDKERLLADLN